MAESKVQSSEHCPGCGSDDNTVTDSRQSAAGRRRRRRCNQCGERWTTVEMAMEVVRRTTGMMNQTMVRLDDLEKTIAGVRLSIEAGLTRFDADEEEVS